DNLSISEEKNLFYNSYIFGLTQRLLNLQFDPYIEKIVVNSLNFSWTLKRRVAKIFEDILLSTKENRLFTSMHSMEKHPLINDFFFFAIITTACMWSITEEDMLTVSIPEPIKDIVDAFKQHYLSRHK